MRDCVKRIVEKSNGKISTAEAKKILNQTDAFARKLTKQGINEDDAVSRVIADRLKNVQTNLKQQKLNTLRNISIKTKLINKVSDRVAQGVKLEDAFLADIVGVEKGFEGSRNSVDLDQDKLIASYTGRFVRDLERQGLLGVFNSKQFTKEIANDLWNLSIEGKTVNKNKQVNDIAKIIFKTQNDLKNRLNKAGADIQDIDGFVMSQTHDPVKMREMGENTWIKTIKPMLNLEKSFDGADNIDEALSGAFQALVTGVRLNDPSKDAKLFQFTGPSNLAKRLSGKRQLIFKSADDFLKYNNELGYGDFNDGILKNMVNSARDIALLERFGTNPQAMLENVRDELSKKYRKDLSKKDSKLPTNYIQYAIDEVTGASRITTNPTLTNTVNNIKAYQQVRLLGGVLISSLSDLPSKALEYQFQGKNILSAYARSIADIGQGFKSKQEKIEFGSLLGVGMEGFIGDLNARFGDNENLSSAASKVTRLFFKLNGLTWWTDTHKLAMGRMMSHELGLKKALSFDKLDVDTKRNLSLYDITAKDWDTIRANTRKLDDGREYVFGEDMPDQKLGEKLTGYYIDRVNHGVITATGSTRARASLGAKRGTGAGEAFSLMMQFKTFPIAYLEKVWGRGLYSKGKADVPALVQTLVMSVVFGYIAGAAKDLIKGKEPKDPLNTKTLIAAMAQGGGLGIYGDLLFADTSGFGKSLADVLGGPTLGQITDTHKLYSAWINGKDLAANSLKLSVNALPFQNLPYLRAPLDNLILYHIQEELNPSYLRRMERRAKTDYNQDYWIKPTQTPNPLGIGE